MIRLVGVYDADGTVRGELAYWVGARLGRTHCALCDITHGLVREQYEWKACRAGLPVLFDTYHRNDQPDAVAAASGGVVPSAGRDTRSVRCAPGAATKCRSPRDRGPRLTHAIDVAVARGRTDLAVMNIVVLSVPDCPI